MIHTAEVARHETAVLVLVSANVSIDDVARQTGERRYGKYAHGVIIHEPSQRKMINVGTVNINFSL